MSKSPSQSGNRMGLSVLALIAMGGVVALASYVKFAPANKVHPEERRTEVRSDTPIVKVDQVQIPKPKVDDNKVTFGSETEPVKSGQNPYIAALQGFFREANLESMLIIERIKLDGNVAQIYFSESSDLYSGSMDESALLLGMRSALGQFPNIEAVELFHGGQKVDELGHFEMSQPMPVVRPDKWADPTKPTEAPVP